LIDLGTIEADDDPAPDIDDRDAHLARSANHIARGGGVSGDVDVAEPDALLAEIGFRSITEAASGCGENDDSGLWPIRNRHGGTFLKMRVSLEV
jgi:hypothetical protein